MDGEGRVEVRYDGGVGPRAAGADTVCLVAYMPGQQVAAMAADARRSRGAASLALPRHWLAGEVHLYAFAVSKHGDASPSAYLGTLREAQAQHFAGAVADAGAFAGPEAYDPYNVAPGILHQPYPLPLQAAQSQFGEEVAHQSAPPHAERLEAVAGLP